MKNKLLLKQIFVIIIGCAIASFGINAFLVPNSIAAGGFSGIAILVNTAVGIPVGAALFALNVPLFIAAFRQLGKGFVLISLFGTVLYSVSIDLLKFLPVFTSDLVLCSIYGGVCVGFGYGIILKYGATTGGTDMMAKLISNKYGSFPIGQMMFLMDLLVIICSVILIGLDKGLYAIISVFVSTKVIDIIIQGTSRSKGFFIVTTKGDAVSGSIMYQLGRGVTILNATGAYTGKKRDVLLCAVSNRAEITAMKEIIYKWDKDAFVLIGDMTEILGEGFYDILG